VIHLAGALLGREVEVLDSLNVDATASLLRTLASADLHPQVILASTGSIYGEPAYLPQDEEHPINALTDYARSKWKTEQIAASLAERLGICVLSARIFNLVGPGQPADLLPGSLALQLAAAAHGLQAPRIRMGPLTTTRDYVDVRDCADALLWFTRCDLSKNSSVNIASGHGTHMHDVWKKLRAIAAQRGGPLVSAQKLPQFSANVSVQIGCTKRLRALGYCCSRPLDRSLRDLYEWALWAIDPRVRKKRPLNSEPRRRL
jgi:nucleoside-diphosphate-sugar epimerase